MFSSLFRSFNIMSMAQGYISKIRSWITGFTGKLMEFVKSATQKPSSKDDYILIKSRYYSKKLLLLGGAVLILGGWLLVTIAYPWADGKLWRTSMEYGCEKFKTFSGKVSLHYNGKVIYIGELSEGKITGRGKLYDENKNLVYEGEFQDDKYSGEGIWYEDNVAVYKGEFANNLFQGKGEQYNSKGKLVYKGDFMNGERSGDGIEFDPQTGKKIYSGAWMANVREGEGTEFDKKDGLVKIYKGAFSAGLYQGEGKLYENEKLKYKGAFSSGAYEGTGTLYDVNTENVIYEGAFVAGKYEGEGKLFDANTGKVTYKGAFVGGIPEGNGETFDKLGGTIYNGEFSEGNIAFLSYIGKTFDDISTDFGRESFKNMVKDSLIVTYLNKNISMVFNKPAQEGEAEESVDSGTGSYVCEKIIVDLKKTAFKGISKNTSADQVKSLLGAPFTSISYYVTNQLESAFRSLSIDIKANTLSPTDKFLMENYMVRLFYTSSKDAILAAEISLV